MGREGKVRLEEEVTRSSSPFLSEHGRNRDWRWSTPALELACGLPIWHIICYKILPRTDFSLAFQ